MEKKRVLMAMSGGIDSTVAAMLLLEQGYELVGVTYRTFDNISRGCMEKEKGCCSVDSLFEAKRMAQELGFEHHILDIRQEFKDTVITNFIGEYLQGRTPNPCVICNSTIKWGKLIETANEMRCDYIATGHYATTVHKDDKVWLGTAVDPVKDQTDFLAQIDYLQVSKLMFPLGGLMKQEVRDIARNAGLPTARRRDSQGICFLGKINYNDFVRRFLGERQGDIIELETGKKIGTHRGYWFHTIGQRKGLGLSGGPWFVIRKDVEANVLYVSRGYDTQWQYGREFKIHDFHFITENPWLHNQEVDVTFKIRHTPEFMKGKLIREGEIYRIVSSENLQGIAPGQFGVVYDEASRICIGSGEIGV